MLGDGIRSPALSHETSTSKSRTISESNKAILESGVWSCEGKPSGQLHYTCILLPTILQSREPLTPFLGILPRDPPPPPQDEPVQKSLQISLGDPDSNVGISEAGRVTYQESGRAPAEPYTPISHLSLGFLAVSRQWVTSQRGRQRAITRVTNGGFDLRLRSLEEATSRGTSSSCRPIRSRSPTSYIHTTSRTSVCEYASPNALPGTDRGLALHETTPTLGEWTTQPPWLFTRETGFVSCLALGG
ncbi:hypothetical protein BT67DRAFT_241278 [Trichocladium antarcticum]|uniref:Uncharacterized protein n=1 Tax=Trichocladium antarcticum TaxID=1450529 RepID=A0AAN6Z9Z5_9PEZI|nr:hypothetical protein BT67DRAFT_241278 [Trichocladium antarcticum]